MTAVDTATAPAGDSTFTPTGSSAFSYDLGGNTTARAGQTLNWTSQNQLAGTAGGGNVYDADGNLLIQVDPSAGSTLYLGDSELHVAAGSSTVTAVRTYTAYGTPVAERSTTAAAPTTMKLSWLNAAPIGQNTVDEEVDATSYATTHRYFDPFGNARGSAPAWSSSRTFLNAPSNPGTGTVHLGAREYDPVLGRFLSADPLVIPADPLQVNGYSYASGDPVNSSDPSGAAANKYLGDNGSCEPLCGGQAAGTLPGANGSTIKITSSGDVTVTYPNGVSGGDAGGHDNVNGVTIPTTSRTHVQIAAFTAGFAANLPKYLHEFGYDDTSGSVSQFDRTDLRNALMEYCTSLGHGTCDEDDIFTGGASGFKEILAAAALGLPVGGTDGIFRGGREADQAVADEGSDSGSEPRNSSTASCGGESFTAETRVVMADRSTKPLDQVKVGDRVEATDPGTGVTVARPVTAVWVNHDNDLMDVIVEAGATTSTIHATQHHLFWDGHRHAWVEADQLKAGERLLTDSGVTAVVVNTQPVAGASDMWDLTVGNDHDFYVVTAAANILVHNCAGPLTAKPDFQDPSKPPGDGWVWRGAGEPGSAKGSWYNPGSHESLHPDLDHPDPVGPHYDWKSPDGSSYRVYPDGTVTPK